MSRMKDLLIEFDELIEEADSKNEKIIFIKKDNYDDAELYLLEVYCAYKGKIIYYE